MGQHLQNEYKTVKEEDLIYDLYGVVNHSGTLNFGHYTANCFNEAHQKWFNYNDSSVTEMKPLKAGGAPTEHHLKREIVTEKAYILFYRRRNLKLVEKEDFESIKVKVTGGMDHMIKATYYTKKEPKAEGETAGQDGKAPSDEKMNADLPPSGDGLKMSKEKSWLSNNSAFHGAADADPDDLAQIQIIEGMNAEHNAAAGSMPAAPIIQDAEMTSDPNSNDVAAGPGSTSGLGDKKYSHIEDSDSDSDNVR